MSLVSFSYADLFCRFNRKNTIKSFIEKIFKREKTKLQKLDYIFCSDSYLLKINQQFLNHHYYTDVITFNLSDSDQIIAEAYISIDRVKENASLRHLTFEQELLRVMFHSALHLCGYNDKTKREILQMRDKEEHYLRLFEKFIR